VIITIVFICTLPLLISIECKWTTVDEFDHDFYERQDFYSMKRITEPLIYSEGKWITPMPTITASSQTNGKVKQQYVQFRGINLPAKTPRTTISTVGTEKSAISFIDRPFPLIDAPSHFQRLSNYGFNIVRLTVTWEAVMHAGPGIIDHAYLQYLSDLVDVACAYGIYVVIDPHQDVWSRMTGGDGAPEWTLDRVGFNMEGGGDFLHKTGVAWLHPLHRGTRYNHVTKGDDNDGSNDEEDGIMESDAIHMGWATNMGRLATATMFTLFFAGDAFATGITIEDVGDKGAPDTCTEEKTVPGSCSTSSNHISLQTFLQKYYLQFISIVAETVKDKPNVLGFNTMNEPSNGMVGASDLNSRNFPFPLANPLSFFDGMRLGSGESLLAEQYSKAFLYQKTVTLNPDRQMVWKSKEHDIWRTIGVYEVNEETQERRLVRPNYFKLEKGKNFLDEFMVPFYEKVQAVVCAQNERFVVFAEPHVDIMNYAIEKAPEALDASKFAWAPHWYDGLTLTFKQYISWVAINVPAIPPVVTKTMIDKGFARTMSAIKNSGKPNMYVLLGETGVPMNMSEDDDEEDDDLVNPTMALDRTLRAVERNNLDYTIWNYCHDNSWLEGDRWNGEDLSIRSSSGARKNRALLSAVRPFVVRIGKNLEIVSQSFDPSLHSKRYELTVQLSKDITRDIDMSGDVGNDVVVYLPQIHFSNPIVKSPSSAVFQRNLHLQEFIWKGVALSCKSEKNNMCKMVIVNDFLKAIESEKNNADMTSIVT